MKTGADLPPGGQGRVRLSDPKPIRVRAPLVTLDNLGPIGALCGGDDSFECLPYQISMVL